MKVLQIELKKAFTGIPFWTILSAGLIIVIWHLVDLYGYMQCLYLEAQPGRNTGRFNLFYWWISVDSVSAAYAVFYGLFPLLASIPYAWSYLYERNSQYYYQIILRCSKEKYIFSKYIAVFLSGGVAVAFPLLVDLLVAALFSPATVPSITFGMPGFQHGNFLSEQYFSHPWVFCFAFLFMDFIWAGVIADLSFYFSLTSNSKIMVSILPTIFLYVEDILAIYLVDIYYSLTGRVLELSILKLLHSWTPYPNPALLHIVLASLLLTISTVSGIILSRKKDLL